MPARWSKSFGPNLLCIAPPPVSPEAPPAGAAYLLGYLQANGCLDFDFLDLRLWVPDAHSPTWSYTGAFGESYVLDIPDLPLVLTLLRAVDDGAPLEFERGPLFDRYCLERAIPPKYLHAYLSCLNRFFARAFEAIPRIDFIGFTVWTTNYLATLLAAAHLKRRRSPPFIVAGGPQMTASKASGELALRSGLVDRVVLGEGEETLLQIYGEFSCRGSVSPDIPGTLSMDARGSFRRVERPLLPIASLPPPSFDVMQLEAYQRDPESRMLPLQFSRGCTDKCSFCSEWKFWRRYRPDTVEHTVENIRELQGRYGADFIVFMDSLLNGVPKRLVELAETLLREEIEIRWASFMRAQMDPETARLLARSGCNDVFVGVESFSDETLERMRKRRTKADNLLALEAFLDAGIGVTAGFIPGFPGDGRSSFIESANVLRELQERYLGRFIVQDEPFVVQPNSPIYEDLANVELTPVPWASEYLDVAPRYADIASDVFATVEGASQGMERAGKARIVQTVSAEALDLRFTFLRGHEESLSLWAFDFEYLRGGWHLARRKSETGHVYGLLVDDAEKDELELLQQIYPLWDGPSRPLASILARLERAHLIRPSRRGPIIARGLYPKKGEADLLYCVSPFVVARVMGWRSRNQILIANVTSDRWFRRPARDVELIELVASKPRTEEQIWREIRSRDPRGGRRRLRRALEELQEKGIFTVCARTRERTASAVRPRAPREALAARAS